MKSALFLLNSILFLYDSSIYHVLILDYLRVDGSIRHKHNEWVVMAMLNFQNFPMFFQSLAVSNPLYQFKRKAYVRISFEDTYISVCYLRLWKNVIGSDENESLAHGMRAFLLLMLSR